MESKHNEYETPRIEDHGDLTELTAGKTVGTVIDVTFPVGTPIGTVIEQAPTHLTTP